MRLLIVISIASMSLLFSACGKDSGSSNANLDSDNNAAGTDPNSSPKSIFSMWTEEGDVFQVDLRSAQFGVTSQAQIISKHVGNCSCQVLIQGSQTGGTIFFSNCTNGSIACVELRPSGNYTKTSSRLQICSNVSCMNLR